MLLEQRNVIRGRQEVARLWIEQYNAQTINNQRQDRAGRALAAIVMTPKTSDYLAEHDPMSLNQAHEALQPHKTKAEGDRQHIIRRSVLMALTTYPPQQTAHMVLGYALLLTVPRTFQQVSLEEVVNALNDYLALGVLYKDGEEYGIF